MTQFLTVLEQLWRMATVICALRSASEALYNVGKVVRMLPELELRVARMETNSHVEETPKALAESR